MEKKKPHYAWLVAICCGLIAFIVVGMIQNTAGIFFQPVAESLGIGRGDFATFVTTQNITTMVILFFAGKVVQKVNIRVLLSACSLVIGGTYIAMSQFTSLYQFYIAGVISGVAMTFCGLMIIPVLINNWFNEKSGTVLGIVMTFSSIGGAVFSPVGSAIIANYGWSAGYLCYGIIALVILMPMSLFVVRFKPIDKGLLPYGAKESEKAQTAAAAGDTELSGVTARKALASPAFYLLVVFTAGATCLSAFNSSMPGYANSLGLSATLGGTAVSFVLMGAIVGKLAIGYFNDKIGIVKTTTLYVASSVIGIILLFLSINVPLFLAGAAFFGISFALTGVQPPILIKQLFGDKEYSVIVSYVTLVTMVSSAVIIPTYGYIYDVTRSYIPALTVVLVLLLLGYLCMLATVKSGKKLKTESNSKKG